MNSFFGPLWGTQCGACGTAFMHPKGYGWEYEVCPECMRQHKADQTDIVTLIKDGHSEHCAQRQVWGDGECECQR